MSDNTLDWDVIGDLSNKRLVSLVMGQSFV